MLRDIELDDREVENFLRAATTPREELIYRLALRGVCRRLRVNYDFRQRLQELLTGVPLYEVSAVLAAADDLERSLRQ
jgi:hypothetical protein